MQAKSETFEQNRSEKKELPERKLGEKKSKIGASLMWAES